MSDSSSSSLVECLVLARRGDGAARERLFAACRSYVALIARANVEKWMQAKVDASDLVQQTLLDAHRDFDQFAGQTEGEWLAWLRQILAHNTGDAIRHFGTAEKRAAIAGFDRLLTKPVDPDVLLPALVNSAAIDAERT